MELTFFSSFLQGVKGSDDLFTHRPLRITQNGNFSVYVSHGSL